MDYLEQFKQECLDPETQRLLVKTKERFDDNIEWIQDKIHQEIDNYFKKLAHWQQKEDKEIVYIQMSMLYSSIYFGRPAWQMEAYGSDLYFEDSLLSHRIQADWLFQDWQEYVGRLENYIKEQEIARWVHKEWVKMNLYQTMNVLNQMFMLHFKYILRDCNELEHFQAIHKGENFYFSYGEYLDWQRLVMAEQERIDMFNCPQGTERTFRRYEDEEYGIRLLKNFVLNGSEFRRCTFYGSRFEDVQFNDCVFEDCEFVDNHMQDCSFCGAVFTRCLWENVTGESVNMGILGLPEEEIKDFYRQTQWNDCVLREVSLTDSNLSNTVLLDTVCEEIVLEQCVTEHSDMQAFEREETTQR